MGSWVSQLLVHSPSVGQRVGEGENKKAKVGKAIAWDKASAICKAKLCTQAKQHGIHALLPMGRWGRAGLHQAQELFGNAHAVTLNLLPAACRGWAWHDSMDYPFGEFGSAGPTVLPPSLLSTPTLLAGWEQSEKLGKLWLCWTIATTSACYQRCFQSEIQNTAPDWLLRAKLTPSSHTSTQLHAVKITTRETCRAHTFISMTVCRAFVLAGSGWSWVLLCNSCGGTR